MAFDVVVDCSKDQARWALMQFALRRGMRIVEPWYLEGVRVEGPPSPSRGAWENHRDGWWERAGSMFFNWPMDRPAVDIELSRKKGRTVVSLSPGSREDCLMLAHRIEAFLRNGGTKTSPTPAVCPTCQSPVEVVTANYCARCGKRLSITTADMPPHRTKQASADRAVDVIRAAQSQPAEAERAVVPESSANSEVVIERDEDRVAAQELSENSPTVDSTVEQQVEPAIAPPADEENREPAHRRRRERDAEAEAVAED